MKPADKALFSIGEGGAFIIENYNVSTNFASFLTGIAGKMGVPMWVFYVNRGQGICSMGVQDKENPIMEFLPANWAYQLVNSQGFRTFLRLEDDSVPMYEPFMNHLRDEKMDRSQKMIIHPSHLALAEENRTLGLQFSVEYHPIPEDEYAGIIRILKITNTGTAQRRLSGLDGLPLIIPYGLDNGQLKFVRRLTEAFIEIENYDKSVPLFKTKVIPADRPDVVHVEKGNFYMGMVVHDNQTTLLDPLVDPTCIFGSNTDYAYPSNYLNFPLEDLYHAQTFENRLPAAMSPFEANLAPGEHFELVSIIGHVDSARTLNDMVPRISRPEYFSQKADRNKVLINEITRSNLILSSEPALDMYTRQNFLDNVMRGGYPYTLKGKEDTSVLHLYSRKHGDLERDYNHFRLTPSHYSQGNANFRDINQNRRSDLFFNPEVGTGNIEHFMNLIQLDGFNPLVIKELQYSAPNREQVGDRLKEYLSDSLAHKLLDYLEQPKTPGEIIDFVQANGHEFGSDADAFLGDLLSACEKKHDASFGEGYWTDHWTYNLDLIENYLAVYPENQNELLFGKKNLTFYDTPHRVKPRSDKYVAWEGKPVQLHSVYLDEEKDELIKSRETETDFVRVDNGTGSVYRTTVFIKLLSTLVNKMSSLDPSGIGVEMETDKPNWYDALNGLPAQIGSSLNETLEVRRNIQFLLGALEQSGVPGEFDVFEELGDLMLKLQQTLTEESDPYSYWDQSTGFKEAYREKVRFGISGNEVPFTKEKLGEFLSACERKLDSGIEKAFKDGSNIPSSYFRHKIGSFEIQQTLDDTGAPIDRLSTEGFPCITVKEFELHHLPLFLEGPVHYLRGLPDREESMRLASSIRQSGLYDKKLKMYKVNECLDDEPHEIGRARTFTPGWFENESIWLHMEYKYMLEILRNGLYDAFFEDFKHVFIPFLDPETYGRSIFENSSFLVSSANPDPSIHGTGYVSRLSGATAEFIQILYTMAMGPKPFDLDHAGHLTFGLEPRLPGWLFTNEKTQLSVDDQEVVSIGENTFSFHLFGDILVSYHNPLRRDTFGENSVRPAAWKITDFRGNVDVSEGPILGADLALKIRSGRIKRIDVELR